LFNSNFFMLLAGCAEGQFTSEEVTPGNISGGGRGSPTKVGRRITLRGLNLGRIEVFNEGAERLFRLSVQRPSWGRGCVIQNRGERGLSRGKQNSVASKREEALGRRERGGRCQTLKKQKGYGKRSETSNQFRKLTNWGERADARGGRSRK